MSTSSSGGGIPLGVVITSGESENTLTESFCHLRSAFPQTVFSGRGMKGPQMFCDAEKRALKNIWPATDQLLCIFHYLQCWWWLWDSKHGIDNADRQPIITSSKSCVQRHESKLQDRYNNLMKDVLSRELCGKISTICGQIRIFLEEKV